MCLDRYEPFDEKESGEKPTTKIGELNIESVTKKNCNAKKKWKKPKDMPKRPLSAYNLFFAEERRQLINGGDADSWIGDSASGSNLISGPSNKNLGFAGLARSVATKWKTLSPAMKAPYEELARREKARYVSQIKSYNDYRLQQQMMGSRPSSPTSPRSNGRHLSHESHDEHDSAPLWPAMPQTIASLGNIYDADNQYGSGNSHGESLKTDHDQLQTNLYTELTSPEGLVETGSNPAARQNPTDSFSFPTRSFQHHLESSTTRRSINDPFVFFQNERISPRQLHNQGLATELSDPDGIKKLASQLDDDQVDFLRSLNKAK